jgi:hypothetical protein
VRRAREIRIPAAKAVAGIVLALMPAAAASYAAAGRSGHEWGGVEPPPRVSSNPTSGSAPIRIVAHPLRLSVSSTARFRVVAPGYATLSCRLDHRAPKPCGPTRIYRRLRPGPHAFFVGTRRPAGRPLRASFAWTVLEPRPFTIESRAARVGPLYPGAAPSPIPIVISNPNPVPIIVTALVVAANGGAPGCDPATNLALSAPNLLTAQPQIPAHGSLALPSATVTAPTIGLRELDVDQDACQRASFDLSFSGSAGS